jgi:spore maturation protein CgeB
MRIFQVFESTANIAIQGNHTWYRNFFEPLVEMGHDVFFFSAEEGRRARERNDASARFAFSEKLLNVYQREHLKKPFDLFFSYIADGMLEPGIISHIKKYGVPTCNFSCNNTHQFYLVKNISKFFDYNLHSERDAREKFLSVGANPLWWPMASNPKYFKPYKLIRTIPVSFSGANYALRARYVSYLLDNGVDVHVYGPTWCYGARTPFRALAKRYIYMTKALIAHEYDTQARFSALLAENDFNRRLYAHYPNNLHPPISDEELIALYSRSHISLGFLEVHENHDSSKNVRRHLHLREFEAPMCGALHCTGYMDELTELFEPDKEMIVYRNEAEMLDKIIFYLSNPNLADAIRTAGHRRAISDHTSQSRFKSLFTTLGLKNDIY